MRDRYYTRLSPGARVADLRQGSDLVGRVLGPAGAGRLQVEWDEDGDEVVFEGDVVAAGGTLPPRRRFR